MTSAGGDIAAGLDYLTRLLHDSKLSLDLNHLLSEWVAALPGTYATFIAPAGTTNRTMVRVGAETIENLSTPPIEADKVVASFEAGHDTIAWTVGPDAGKLYTRLQPHGHAPGLLGVERKAPAWTATDRAYLALSARLFEKMPAVTATFGTVIDNSRLSQRLADAAIIAGRMAHDFDNILTGIIGFADLTQPSLVPGSQPAKFVAEISAVGQRGIAFTQQLHQFSRAGHTHPQPGSIAAAFGKESARIEARLPAGATITSDIAPGLPLAAIDLATLQIVIGHLLDNSVESLAAAGTIQARAEAVELNASEARALLGTAGPGASVALTITDTGDGIKPEHRGKLFHEPFFTTKVRHRGLGLAVVHRIVSAHRGGIRIDAASPAPGTVVRVVFPQAAARAASPAATAPLTGEASHAR